MSEMKLEDANAIMHCWTQGHSSGDKQKWLALVNEADRVIREHVIALLEAGDDKAEC